ncbi:MAG: hypothetical protein RI885_544 [Actinomycetota bacterium]|jgi:hypothetical protein
MFIRTRRVGSRPGGSLLAAIAAAVLLTLSLSSCVASAPAPSNSPTEQTPDATAPTPSPEPLAYDATGTAQDNLAYFDEVNLRLLSAGATPGGRPIIDNLVAAGFDRSAMQVTSDTTTIGAASDSVEFSVRIGSDCLVGQSSDAGYASTVGPALAEGACLAGATRPIDW